MENYFEQAVCCVKDYVLPMQGIPSRFCPEAAESLRKAGAKRTAESGIRRAR